MSTLVLYFIQGELGESPDVPNAFMIPLRANEISYEIFLQHFPLIKHSKKFHFRFKTEDKSHGFVWMDINQSDKLPIYQEAISVKVLRTDSALEPKRRLLLKQKAANSSTNITKQVTFDLIKKFGLVGSNPNVTNNPPNNNVNSSSTKTQNNKNQSESNNHQSAVSPVHKNADSQHQNIQSSSSIAESKEKSESKPEVVDMLNFSDSTFDNQYIGPSVDIDGAFSAPVTAPIHLNRDELKAKVEADITDKVKVALDFKREMDDRAVKEAEDLDVARDKYEKSLTAWAFNNKERRNVRTLLTTMHTVLWKDNNWKTIGLGDVIEPKQVKFQYRKAMMVVHPDKVSDKSTEIQFIAKRCFEAINEAWDEFLKKESV
eukprot:gene12820-17190_t